MLKAALNSSVLARQFTLDRFICFWVPLFRKFALSAVVDFWAEGDLSKFPPKVMNPIVLFLLET